MQIDSTDGPSSSSAPSTQTAAFTYGFNSSHFQQQQQQPFALASSMGYAGTEYQERPPRHRAPVGLFSSGLMPNSSNSIMHNNSIQQQGSSSMQLHGSNTSSLDGFPSSSLQSSITAAAEPSTPIGSPMKGANTGSASRSAAKGTGGLGSPSWFSPKSRVKYSDRFIPSRAATARLDFSALDREVVADQVNSSAQDREDLNPAYNMLLRSELLGCQCPSPISPDKATQLEQLRSTNSPAKKILRFKSGDSCSPITGPTPPSHFLTSPVGAGNVMGSPVMSPRRPPRKIPRAPYKVLDAPALADDFYLNLVDWSAQNLLAVGLDSCVYLWSAHTSKVTKLCELAPGDSVCSVAWSQRGTYLSLGTHAGDVQIWDVTKLKRTRTMAGHRQRVGTQAWSSHMLASGSRDKSILLRDVRAPEPYVDKWLGHKSEVCGLKWSPDDRQLASGGNDNALLVWHPGTSSPVCRFCEHTAAVKAIAWSPHQHGLLASGGGTADRCIRFWNTTTNSLLNCVDTGSQVCNLAWSKNVNELVSAHGYSQNQIIVWKYPSMAKLATLTGHSYRVLYLAIAPDGQTIVTGAGDETLRFWSVFPGPKVAGTSGANAPGTSMMRTTIR